MPVEYSEAMAAKVWLAPIVFLFLLVGASTQSACPAPRLLWQAEYNSPANDADEAHDAVFD
jgi:hypothetical protein